MACRDAACELKRNLLVGAKHANAVIDFAATPRISAHQEQQYVGLNLHAQASTHPGLETSQNENSSQPPRARMLTSIGTVDQYCRLLLERVGPFTDPPGGHQHVIHPVMPPSSRQSALEHVQAGLRASNQWRDRIGNEDESDSNANTLTQAMSGVRKAVQVSRTNPAAVA